MKKNVFLTCILACSLQAFGKDPSFLTYYEFQSLGQEQQVEYIQALQKFVMDLSENSLLVSDSSTKVPNLYSYFFQKAHASVLLELCSVSSARQYSNEALLEKVQSMNECREPRSVGQKAASTAYLPPVEDSLVVLSEEMSSRLQKGSLNIKNYKVRETHGMLLGHLREAQTHFKNSNAQSRLSQAYKTLNLAPVSTLTSKRDHPAPDVVSKPEFKSKSKQMLEAENSSSESRGASEGHCLYAGFVIPKSNRGCQPYKELPELFQGFFDSQSFRCERASEIICNPLLFGYIEKCDSAEKKTCFMKKPVCVNRSRFATKNCHSKSESIQASKHVVDIWKSAQGKGLYNKYVDSLSELCNPESLQARKLRASTKNDIMATCQVAFENLEIHIERLRLPQKLRPGEDKSKSVQ